MSAGSGNLSSRSSRIQDWLDNLTPPGSARGSNRASRSLKRKRETRSELPDFELPTPPESQKRPRLMDMAPEPHLAGSIGADTEVEESRIPPSISMQSSIRPGSSASQASSHISKRTRGERGSNSPIKKSRYDDRWLNKPIRYLDWEEVKNLPLFKVEGEIGEIVTELASIRAGTAAFIPKALKNEIKKDQYGAEPFTDSNLLDDGRPLKVLEHELYEVEWILRNQRPLKTTGGPEAAWDIQVWARILHCVVNLQSKHGISWMPIPAAQIEKEYLPYVGSVEAARDEATAGTPQSASNNGKKATLSLKVDHALTMIPEPPARRVIEKIIQQRSNAGRAKTINQSAYYEIKDNPIAIIFEGKTPDAAGAENSTAQLAIWTAAWYNSVESLLPQELLEKRGPLTWLPLISIRGKSWKLFCAVDDVQNNRLIITELDWDLGSTATMIETYKLLASLKILMKWADGKYRAWWNNLLEVADSDST